MPPKASRKVSSHKCEFCSYLTHRRSFMNDHIRVHTGEKPFRCETCGKSFSQKSNLRQHLKVHNQGNNHLFRCKLCDFETKWKSSLQVHDRMHNGEKPYKCKICDRAFSQSTHCQTHMREAHLNMRKFQCDVCSKTFKRHEHLERHMAFHKMQRDHECDICHKKYLDARYLKQHKLIHEGDASKVHSCPNCPYKSRYKQGLRIHMRTHTGLRPYKCEDCSKTFSTRQSLTLHMRMVHQGQAGKIFHCDLCGFMTANKQALKGHLLKIHHKGQASPKCKFCHKVYHNQASMTAHMSKAHPKLMAEGQRLRQEGKAAVKIIGSLSKSHSIESIGNSARLSMKLKRRAVSPKPAGYKAGLNGITIKQEPVEVDLKPDELTEGSLGRNIQAMLGGKPQQIAQVQEVVASPNRGLTQGQKETAEKAMNSKQGGSKRGVNGLASGALMTELKDSMQNHCSDNDDILIDESQKRNGSSDRAVVDLDSESDGGCGGSSHTAGGKRSRNDFLRIKLNSPKAGSKKSKSPSLEIIKDSQSPVQNIKVKSSPGSDRKKQKSPVPSAERARKLFVSPDIYIDRDVGMEPAPEPLHQQNGGSHLLKDHDNNNDDILLVDHFQKKIPQRNKESRQYDSLRAIVSAFQPLTDSIDPRDVAESEDDVQMIHETIHGENGELIEIHMMKEEPEGGTTDLVNSNQPNGYSANTIHIKTEAEAL